MNFMFPYNKKLVDFCLHRIQSVSPRFPILQSNVEHLYPTAFSILKSSFHNLPIDTHNDKRLQEEYQVSTVPPTRFRRYAEFTVQVDNAKVCQVKGNYQPTYEFSQQVHDFRSRTRILQSIEPHILGRTFLPEFVSDIGSLVHALESAKNTSKGLLSTKMTVSVHQVRQVCYPNLDASNSPEGIHQDGADYIVSALVVNRRNIHGGCSTVYAPNKKNVILDKTLRSGDFVFQEDRNLWHYVTPIRCSTEDFCGYRDIFGLDIHVCRE